MKKISLHPILLIILLLFIIYGIIILVKKIMFDKTKPRSQSVDELNKWNFYFEPYRYFQNNDECLDNECLICLSEFTEENQPVHPCSNSEKHCYHYGCVKQWIDMGKTDCPYCKQPIKQSFLDELRQPEDMEIERQVDTLINRLNQIDQSIVSNNLSITIPISREIENLFIDYLRIISELTNNNNLFNRLENKISSFNQGYRSIIRSISDNDLIYQLDNLLLIISEIENESSKIYFMLYNLFIYYAGIIFRKIRDRQFSMTTQQIESSLSVLSYLFNTYNINLIKILLTKKLIDISFLDREIIRLDRVATTQRQINFKNELRSVINMYRNGYI